MSTAADTIATLRKKARRQKVLTAVSAALFALVALLTANGFGLLSGPVEWPVKIVIWGAAAAFWAYRTKAIDNRVEHESQAALDANGSE